MSLHQPLADVLRTTRLHLKKLEEIGIKNIQDLLLYFPRGYQDKSVFTPISELRTDEINTVKGFLDSIFHKRLQNGKTLTRGMLTDETGSIEVIWFNQPYLRNVLQNGKEIILSGKAKFKLGKISLQSPSYEAIKKEQMHVGRIIPVYHQTEGITSKWLREKIKPLISSWGKLFHEYMPENILKDYHLISYADAVSQIHFPTTEEELEKAKKRLSFDELFLLQLKAFQKKWKWQNIQHQQQKQISLHADLEQFLKTLPFELTKSQHQVLEEILDDLKKPYPMSRLLQGDVGSGKTVVAGAAILNTIQNGYQAALMAPTEILAKQHYNTLFQLLRSYSLNLQFISGSTPAALKQKIFEQLETGRIDLIIGTHSLIQENVQFQNLGLAVIDEQHRFGVKQRDILKSHGSPHLLSLSATPIPRTLAMTIYGDQDISLIDEMPQGRQTIITRLVPEKKRIDAYRWIENQIEKGRQAFIICPLIDESDFLEVKSALQEYSYLKENVFPKLKIGLLHGKMKAKEKEEIMTLFAQNKLNILISTSVIEVGIDVPNATIMIIEDAERFGLSQLHQFRGRVGRGKHQSYCFIFTKNSSEDALRRLKSMVQHSSGFTLAEIDLSIRGPGEIYGVRQSGIPDLKMASLTDSITINLAREAAQKIIKTDPELEKYPALKQKISNLTEVFIND